VGVKVKIPMTNPSAQSVGTALLFYLTSRIAKVDSLQHLEVSHSTVSSG